MAVLYVQVPHRGKLFRAGCVQDLQDTWRTIHLMMRRRRWWGRRRRRKRGRWVGCWIRIPIVAVSLLTMMRHCLDESKRWITGVLEKQKHNQIKWVRGGSIALSQFLFYMHIRTILLLHTYICICDYYFRAGAICAVASTCCALHIIIILSRVSHVVIIATWRNDISTNEFVSTICPHELLA